MHITGEVKFTPIPEGESTKSDDYLSGCSTDDGDAEEDDDEDDEEEQGCLQRRMR